MNTNRIKQALAEGKAIHCKTEDEARQLFEVMGWDTHRHSKDGMSWFCYPHYLWTRDSEKDWNGCDGSSFGREVIPFTALTRSRLAECLGVEDGQKFIFRNDVYSVECSGEKLRQWSSDGMNFWSELEIAVLLDMIAHPEEITPCPRWSEDSVMRAAALLTCGLESLRRTAGAARGLYVSDGVSEARLRSDVFPEIHPGATVRLEDIK